MSSEFYRFFFASRNRFKYTIPCYLINAKHIIYTTQKCLVHNIYLVLIIRKNLVTRFTDIHYVNQYVNDISNNNSLLLDGIGFRDGREFFLFVSAHQPP